MLNTLVPGMRNQSTAWSLSGMALRFGAYATVKAALLNLQYEYWTRVNPEYAGQTHHQRPPRASGYIRTNRSRFWVQGSKPFFPALHGCLIASPPWRPPIGLAAAICR